MQQGSSAFGSCLSLTSVVIPSSLSFIGNDAFKKCDKLADIYYRGTKEEWMEIKGRSFKTKPTIHYDYVPE